MGVVGQLLLGSLLTCSLLLLQREALPHLQSLVIVLLKAIVAIASNLVAPAQNGGQQPQQPGAGAPAAAAAGQNGRVNGAGPGQVGNVPNGVNGAAPKGDLASPSDSDVDEARSREIAAKAVTGILIMLLKWLKISRKFIWFYYS